MNHLFKMHSQETNAKQWTQTSRQNHLGDILSRRRKSSLFCRPKNRPFWGSPVEDPPFPSLPPKLHPSVGCSSLRTIWRSTNTEQKRIFSPTGFWLEVRIWQQWQSGMFPGPKTTGRAVRFLRRPLRSRLKLNSELRPPTIATQAPGIGAVLHQLLHFSLYAYDQRLEARSPFLDRLSLYFKIRSALVTSIHISSRSKVMNNLIHHTSIYWHQPETISRVTYL